MAKAEKVIQREIIDYLEDNGCYVVKIIQANKNGVSDLLACCRGHFIAIEVKAEGKLNGATYLQKHHQALVVQSGGNAIITDSLEDVVQLIKNIKENK